MLPAEMKAALLAVLEDSDLRTQVRALLGVEERDREIAVLKDTNKAQQRLIEEQEERLSELEQYSRKTASISLACRRLNGKIRCSWSLISRRRSG